MSTSPNAQQDTGSESVSFDEFIQQCAEEFGWSLTPPPPPTPRTFDIFNDRHFSNHHGNSSQESFFLFTDLPCELRQEIWAINLRQHRFLDVVLSSPTKTADDERARQFGSTDTELQNSPNKAARYRAVFRYRLSSLSTLFAVCRESASVAKNFYSIRIACSTPLEHVVHMPLSPEWDTLNIHTHELRDCATAVADFLYDLKTADLHGRGALRLCLDHRGVKALSDLDVSQLPPHARQFHQATIAGLHSLYWRCTPAASLTRMGGNFLATWTAAWYSTTMPLLPGPNLAADAVEVEFLDADIRCIAPDLHQVWIGRDPRPFLSLWSQIQCNAGISEVNSQCRCRLLLAADPWQRGDRAAAACGEPTLSALVGGRASVDAYLSQEVAEFRSHLAGESHTKNGFSECCLNQWSWALQHRAPPGVSPGASTDEFMDVRVPETALGFWLLDPADLERLPPNHENLAVARKGVWGLTELGTKPELCVFNLGRR